MKIMVDDYIFNYIGGVSTNRDKSKDKNHVGKYKVVNIVSDPSGGKPTLFLNSITNEEVDRTKKHYWISNVYPHYDIVFQSNE